MIYCNQSFSHNYLALRFYAFLSYTDAAGYRVIYATALNSKLISREEVAALIKQELNYNLLRAALCLVCLKFRCQKVKMCCSNFHL